MAHELSWIQTSDIDWNMLIYPDHWWKWLKLSENPETKTVSFRCSIQPPQLTGWWSKSKRLAPFQLSRPPLAFDAPIWIKEGYILGCTLKEVSTKPRQLKSQTCTIIPNMDLHIICTLYIYMTEYTYDMYIIDTLSITQTQLQCLYI